MEGSSSEKDLIQVYYQGEFYLEWTEVCEVIGTPRTTVLRLVERYDLLPQDQVLHYKNRKLVKTQWAFDFWRNLTSNKRGQG